MPHYDPYRHRRTSRRLSGRDYTRGVYFVTIVAKDRCCLFGRVVDSRVELNPFGRIVEAEWRRSEELRPELGIDAYIVMPDHIHGIVVLRTAARRTAPPQSSGEGHPRVIPGSLGASVRAFKAAVSKRINEARGISGVSVWQRGYYERVLSNRSELNHARQYITDNPATWSDA